MSGKTARVGKPGSAIKARSPVFLPIRHRNCFGRFAAPLQEEMNALFDEVFADTETSGEGADISFPVIDISETERTYNVDIQVPGMRPEDLDVSTTYNFLTIAGERKGKPAHPAFHRTLSLPETADTGKAKASFKKGVLNISIPKRTGISHKPAKQRAT